MICKSMVPCRSGHYSSTRFVRYDMDTIGFPCRVRYGVVFWSVVYFVVIIVHVN